MKKTTFICLMLVIITAIAAACGKETETRKANEPTEEPMTEEQFVREVVDAIDVTLPLIAKAYHSVVIMVSMKKSDYIAREALYYPIYLHTEEPILDEPLVDRQVIDRSDPNVIAALNAYKEVLSNSKNFHLCGGQDPGMSKESMYVNELSDVPYRGEAESFAIIDLDYNQVPELLLAYGSDETIIFRCQGEKVFAYDLYIRSFMCLKIDGTYATSSGGSEGSYDRMSFVGRKYISESFIEWYYGSENHRGYCINDKAVTDEEFYEIGRIQESKPDVTWYELSEENIAKYIS